MAGRKLKILFISDTHLGFDLSFQPRTNRRRRGHDFMKNFKTALETISSDNIDLIIHGGDLFFRSKVPDQLVDYAFEPIMKVAESGTPFLIVPGNHERSFIPRSLFHTHNNLMVFDEPRTFNFFIDGISLSIAGLPFHKNNIRDNFTELVKKTKVDKTNSDFNLLCLHHAIEGATVGQQNYVFRKGEDVIRGSDIPGNFDIILSGHIHRAQVLTKDLSGNDLAAPVIYAGSVERTSFAEQNEEKGYYVIELVFEDDKKEVNWIFKPFATRKMITLEIETTQFNNKELEEVIRKKLLNIDKDGIVQVRLKDENSTRTYNNITTAFLRSVVPETVNISLSFPGISRYNKNE
ncbi:MAG: DNA repair exonuclease [Bacteroidetes bacterium]|nr:DNA repair exonuclease [Bacteroidota bacterium]